MVSSQQGDAGRPWFGLFSRFITKVNIEHKEGNKCAAQRVLLMLISTPVPGFHLCLFFFPTVMTFKWLMRGSVSARL